MPEARVELGYVQNVLHNVLDTHPVEVLLVDGVAVEIWMPWVTKCATIHRPQAIIWSGSQDSIIDESSGPINKSFRKQMKRA
jgi:hypothetical protein